MNHNTNTNINSRNNNHHDNVKYNNNKKPTTNKAQCTQTTTNLKFEWKINKKLPKVELM